MQLLEIYKDTLAEIGKAEAKHPTWPSDVVHGAAITAEECGSMVKAALDFYYGRGDRAQLKKEMLHMIAMGFRVLLHLDDYRPWGE